MSRQTAMIRMLAVSVVAVVLLGLAWSLGAARADFALLAPSLGDALQKIGDLWNSGNLQPHIGASLLTFAQGFALAAVAGLGAVGVLSVSLLAHRHRKF